MVQPLHTHEKAAPFSMDGPPSQSGYGNEEKNNWK